MGLNPEVQVPQLVVPQKHRMIAIAFIHWFNCVIQVQ